MVRTSGVVSQRDFTRCTCAVSLCAGRVVTSVCFISRRALAGFGRIAMGKGKKPDEKKTLTLSVPRWAATIQSCRVWSVIRSPGPGSGGANRRHGRNARTGVLLSFCITRPDISKVIFFVPCLLHKLERAIFEYRKKKPKSTCNTSDTTNEDRERFSG